MVLMGDERRSSLLAQRRVTRREAEVLDALTERLTNAEIAARLYLSERTVESHVSSLLRKLEACNRVELGDLARELRAAQRQDRPAPLPAPLALLADPAHFVGREPEQARLRGLWHRATEGHFLVGVVAGEAGIGKTRLVAELAADVHASGAQVLLGSCFQDLRVPYEPFVQAVSADVATQSTVETRRRAAGAVNPLTWLIPELAGAGTGPAPDASPDSAPTQAELFAGLYGYFVRAADIAPVLLVIEDVQWATSTTLGAVRHLARVSGHARVLVVVTTRVGPPDLNADLALYLAELRRLPAVDPIDLAGLSEPEVNALIDALGGRRDPSAVHAATGGNPLLVGEVLGGSASRLGPLRALLTRRYNLVDQDDLAVLDLAAVAGAEFDADLLAAAGDRPLPAVVDALERAELAGLVARQPGRSGRFSFVHGLFRDARYDGIPPSRRMELHGLIARALEERSDERLLPEMARHAARAARPTDAEHSGGPHRVSTVLVDRARRTLRQSGDRAMALNDYTAAHNAYQRALVLWPEADPERPALLLEMGRALFTAQRQGGDVLGEARDGLLRVGDRDGAAEAEMMLGELDWIASRWDDAEVHFARAETLIADRPASCPTARVTAALARLRMIANDNREARRLGARALETARGLGLPDLEANALNTLGPTRAYDGDLGGVDDLQAGIRLAEELRSPEVFRGYANLAYVYGILGDHRRSRQWRRHAGEAAERFGLADGARWIRVHDIEDRFHIGLWDEALECAEDFIIEAEPSAHYLVTVCLRVRASARLGRGNQIGALADAAAALEFARGARHPFNLLVALPFLARSLVETGRRARADAAVTETLHAATGNENIVEPIDTAIAMLELGRLAEYLDLAARATLPSKRLDIGRAIARNDLAKAADMSAGQEHRTTEAYLRLMAAERLTAKGCPGEAQRQLHRALAFHRAVGAITYVSRGERLLATVA
jgi:DNA-binding CsgD family transcriptional regulator/tetratricopeptide (TPR) repeat protein